MHYYYCIAIVTSQLRTAYLLPEAATQQLDCAEVNDKVPCVTRSQGSRHTRHQHEALPAHALPYGDKGRYTPPEHVNSSGVTWLGVTRYTHWNTMIEVNGT